MNMLAVSTERPREPTGKRLAAHRPSTAESLSTLNFERKQPIFLLHLRLIGDCPEIAPDRESYPALAERNELPSDILRYEWRLYKAVLSTEWALLDRASSGVVTEQTRARVSELHALYRSIITPDMVVVVARLNDPEVRNFDRYTVLSRF